MDIRLHLRDWGLVWVLCVLFGLFAIFAAILWPGQKKTVYEGTPILRIAALENEFSNSRLSPFGPGIDRELAETLCRKIGPEIDPKYGIESVFVWIDSWNQGWKLLERGEVDVLAGPGLTPPAHLKTSIVSGPAYATSHPQFVIGGGGFGRFSLRMTCQTPPLLQMVQPFPGLFSTFSQKIGCDTQAPVSSVPGLSPLFSAIESGETPIGLAEGQELQLLEPFNTEYRATRMLIEKVSRRWHWLADSKYARWLHPTLMQMHHTQLKNLENKYFGFFPDRPDYYEIDHLKWAVREKLPVYREMILRAARSTRIDPLFLAAVIYQESRFDRHARSSTGVRGLMQISQDTARHLGISNRTDPRQSIDGGSRYLRYLYMKLEGKGITGWDRWFVTLASYNQGYAHALDALRLTRWQGRDATSWRQIRRSYWLLRKEKYYKTVKYGPVRGNEAIGYVKKVRYFYYILKGLSVLPGAERKELAPLVQAFPVHWPALQ